MAAAGARALVIAPHGAQKLLGWFGGYGPEGTLGYFASLGIPRPLGALVIGVESLGMLALALGLGTRLVAGGLSLVMAGAIALVHGRFGFFLNWFGQQSGEGFQFHLLVLALALPLAIRGGGAWSADRELAQLLGARRRTALVGGSTV